MLTTKAELNIAVMGMQDALFMKNIPKLLELEVKLTILASVNKNGAVDFGNNLSIDRRTCHVEVKQNFLWELKEACFVEFQWV